MAELPFTIRQGYQLPPALGDCNRAFSDHVSIERDHGLHWLYPKIEFLLLDSIFVHFCESICLFEKSPSFYVPKIRIVVQRLWRIEEVERLFFVSYFDSIEECRAYLGVIAEVYETFTWEQGFGIHRFDPEAMRFSFDENLTELVRKKGGSVVGKLTFISASSMDYGISENIYHLFKKNSRSAFFAPISLPETGKSDYLFQIDLNIEKSESLVVVASNDKSFSSPWFDQEWRTWLNEKRSGRKKGNIVTFVGEDFNLNKLPLALRYFEARPLSGDIDGIIQSYF